MNKRILIDATTVNITQPGGGSFCVQAYIEALLALYPDKIDVLHPQEAHIRDERYNTIDVPKRNTKQIIKDTILHRLVKWLTVGTGNYSKYRKPSADCYNVRTI